MIKVSVFTNEKGKYGNPLGIVIDTEKKISHKERLKITNKSGLSELVFVDNFNNRKISIYSPKRKISFAGHAVLGAAFFFEKILNKSISKITTMDKEIDIWFEGERLWAKGKLSTTPSWWHEKLDFVNDLEMLKGPQSKIQGHTQLWAWMDEKKGIIRARTFAADWGIPEDEANGSGSMRLAAALGRSLIINHGRGSLIHARPSGPGYAEIGGLVKILK